MQVLGNYDRLTDATDMQGHSKVTLTIRKMRKNDNLAKRLFRITGSLQKFIGYMGFDEKDVPTFCFITVPTYY